LEGLTQGRETLENIELQRSKSNKGIRVALVLAVTNFIIATAIVGIQHFYFDRYVGSIGLAAWLWIVSALVMSCVIFLVVLQSAKLQRLIKGRHRGSRIAAAAFNLVGLSVTLIYLYLYILWASDYIGDAFYWAERYSVDSAGSWFYSFDYVIAFGVTLLPAIIFPIFTAAILWALKSGREQS